MTLSFFLACLAATAWGWLLLFRGRFWMIEPLREQPEPEAWPEVVAVVPARDEADVIGEAVRSLLAQEYPGKLSVVVTDDHSRDGTAEVAGAAAAEVGAADRLEVIPAAPLPAGWAGKMWAQSQALAAAAGRHPNAELWLLTDADIGHAPGELRRMVARMLADRLDMASLMVRLSTAGFAEKLIIPAFVFFFRLLYPFRWVANPAKPTAAAAGGYVLIRRAMLDKVGGVAAIKDALIDDCTLAAVVKQAGGRLSLDMARRTVSLRRYPGLGSLWMMIARSAYTQLRCSPLLLAGTVVAMAIGFVLPPLYTFLGGPARVPAVVAWFEMAVAFTPMLRFYGLPIALRPFLPIIALFYLGATVDSARRHWLGRGGEWKGRVQAVGEGREAS